jgi:hypothetical protein
MNTGEIYLGTRKCQVTVWLYSDKQICQFFTQEMGSFLVILRMYSS